jgi:hypothetical protein
VKPAGIGAGWDEQDDKRPALRCLKAFARPLADLSAIGWIAEYAVCSPILLESVLLLGEEQAAFGIFSSCARIESELVAAVKPGEKCRRSRPFFRRAAVEDWRYRHCRRADPKNPTNNSG